MKARIPKNDSFDDEFEEGYNPYLRETLFEIVDNQLIIRRWQELLLTGYTKEQAKEKIAAVVLVHAYEIINNHEQFNGEQYIKDLSELE